MGAQAHTQGAGVICRCNPCMRVLVLFVVLCFAAPATAQAAEGDIIVVREPGASASPCARTRRQARQGRSASSAPTSSSRVTAMSPTRSPTCARTTTSFRRGRHSRLRRPDPGRHVLSLDVGPARIFAADAWELSEGAAFASASSTPASTPPRGPRRPGARRLRLHRRDAVAPDGDGDGHARFAGTIAALIDNGRGVIGVARWRRSCRCARSTTPATAR